MKKKPLFQESEFVKQIEKIADHGTSDLRFVEHEMNLLEKRIKEFSKGLSGILKNPEIKTLSEKYSSSSGISQESEGKESLGGFLTSLQETLDQEIFDYLETNKRHFLKKKEGIKFFTFSFLGRTKAGKSTLHAVLTKEGYDAIGKGKLRTTRENRVYPWNNLRIIDTPGIGAPNGKSDVEIAESIIDESDFICYIVTNDAIQETEFKFLSTIQERNKPVIILLNVKDNIEGGFRRKKFLKDPRAWKETEGPRSIQGHFQRIEEYMEQHYKGNYYRIIPVMLLAAVLSDHEKNAEIKELLYQGSNMEEFLSCMQDSVFNNSFLRKSQNIFDGANYYIYKIKEELKSQFSFFLSPGNY